MTDQEHEDRLVLSRLRFSHMQQSIERAMDDPAFIGVMCDPIKNPAPNLDDLSPHRTLN
jgi:hypothetical protein